MQLKPKVKVLALEQKPTRSWIGLFILALFLFISFNLASCSSAPAAVAEPPAAVEEISTLPAEISVDQAYQKYQDGTFLLDVRTPEEWDEYHAPNTTLIPLDQLEMRLDELPKGEEIVVVCRSGNRSQVGRDILLANGFDQTTSMAGGLKTWRASGYPVE
jgi:rhodanese-related sulfurtransferase